MIQIRCNGEETGKLFGEGFVKKFLSERSKEPFTVNLNENTCIVRNLSIALSVSDGEQIDMNLEILKRYSGNGMETHESEIRK